MVVTRSAAKKLDARRPSPAPAPASKPSTAAPHVFRTALIDSSGVMVTVEPSATGQGVHTRWEYNPMPLTTTTSDSSSPVQPTPDASPSSSQSSSTSSSSSPVQTPHTTTTTTTTTTPPNDRFATPAPRDSLYHASVLCTPRAKARPIQRSPRRYIPLADETRRYQLAMQDAMNRAASGSPHTPIPGRPLPSQESQENVFQPGHPHAKDIGLGKPVTLRRAPLHRYDTIRWDEGCGEPPIPEEPVIDKESSPQDQQKSSPLARCSDRSIRPLLGPEGTQMLGPQGTHLLLGASAGPIYDTQVALADDSLMDIDMDVDGHWKGPIGPNGEKLSPEGKQRLGPSGTFLHYDVNELKNRYMDRRMEAMGFVEEGSRRLSV
ncbi:hypothetical protein ONZ45_g18966 [Pleurotus djamor]|nr:hypothetical protein ONZ45_g18966 [Pleurotus djamor]